MADSFALSKTRLSIDNGSIFDPDNQTHILKRSAYIGTNLIFRMRSADYNTWWEDWRRELFEFTNNYEYGRYTYWYDNHKTKQDDIRIESLVLWFQSPKKGTVYIPDPDFLSNYCIFAYYKNDDLIGIQLENIKMSRHETQKCFENAFEFYKKGFTSK